MRELMMKIKRCLWLDPIYINKKCFSWGSLIQKLIPVISSGDTYKLYAVSCLYYLGSSRFYDYIY